jgi:putative flippase GtrA
MQLASLARRAPRFAVSGIIATGIHAVVAAGVMNFVLPSPPLANTLGFAIATVSSYLVNTMWSFSSSPDGRNFRRFVLVSLLGCGMAAAVSALAQHYGFDFWVGFAFVVLTAPPMTFLLHNYWTYR